MIYFTSDLHLGHKGIISMKKRPFDNVTEMNQVIIENFNACVHKDDTVYFLGDICHRLSVESANEMIASFNGKKYLIKGNHDKKYDKNLFIEMTDFKEIAVNGSNISLMHYPMLSWPKSHRGSIQLHGHVHSDKKGNIMNREQGIMRYDVGVDANMFIPVSIEQILRFFQSTTR